MASTQQADDMKTTALIIALGLSSSVFAQGRPGMSEADMQKMMQNMQSAQTCMQGVDMAKLDAFGKRARQVESEIKSLCANGERDAAMEKGMAFAREVNSDPEIGKMRKCGEMMQGMMPPMPGMSEFESSDKTGKHVCDE